MSESTHGRHRWFQFGLRSMFVVVTLVAIFVTYHVNWIHQRHQLSVDGKHLVGTNVGNEVRAPGLLWLFGEPGYASVQVAVEGANLAALTDADLQAGFNARRLFPEADISAYHFLQAVESGPISKLTQSWSAAFPFTPEMRVTGAEMYEVGIAHYDSSLPQSPDQNSQSP